jgi:hypothetical protein
VNTTIYLDVDGVLNAVSMRVPTSTGWPGYEAKRVNGYRIMYAPAVVDRINRLAERDDVTIKWLTTWEHDAAQILSPQIGLNGQGWEVLTGCQDAHSGRDWWKLQAIDADVAAHPEDGFVWLDDDIAAEPDAVEWARRRNNGIWISPRMREGLTLPQLVAVDQYLDAGKLIGTGGYHG